jgi:non-ribosomal peptide synthetase component F
MASPEGEAQLAYWRTRLSDPGPALDLPYDRAPRPGGLLAMSRGGNCQAVIGEDVTAAVATFAKRAATTPYVVMLAAFKVLIFKYSGRSDLLVTATVAGRTRPEFERIIGWFGNLVIFRSLIDPQASFRSLVDQLAVTVLEGLANQDCPAPQAFAAADPGYMTNRTALNQVGFCMTRPDNLDDRGFGLILLNSGDARMEFGGIEIESIPVEACAAPRDLTISVQEFDGRVYVSLDYNADAFDHSTAARIAADYEAMLRAALEAPDETIAALAARPGARADAAAAEA